jgi:type I restriction enzyme, S subunit
MNNETMLLLERHFDAAFAAPDGIKKLRELILTLAMQGKLVPQDPNDEPASELLKAIEIEKQQMIKDGKIKQPKPLPKIKTDHTTHNLPNGWQWVRLGQVANYNGRKNIHSEEISPEAWLLDLEDIEKDTSRIICRAKYSERQSKSTKSTFQKGDVLYGKLRPYLNKVVVADIDGVCTTEIVPIVLLGNIDSQFFKWLLKRASFSEHVNSLMYGVKMPRLGTDDANMSIHPLPPIAEQKRIVAEIDRLMARCDELEKLRADRSQRLLTVHTAALDNLLKAKESSDFGSAWHFITQNFSELYSVKENVAELRKAILQLAVMGKLVPQESAPRIGSLQSILAESSINGVSKGPTSDTSATEVLRISAGTSQKDFYVNENDFKHVDLSASEIQKFKLVAGDLLACRFNGNLHYVGRFSYYRDESGRLQVNPDKLIRFRIDTESHCPRYVCYMMNAAQTRDVIEAMCATTAGNIGLSAGRLKTIKIPLPLLAEQHRIVAEIDQLMEMCDRLEELIEALKDKQTDLLNALMSQV